jgi:large subunit ribosomal protein L27
LADSRAEHFSPSTLLFKRWATKKAAGVSNNNRKSNPKYLGVKKSHGELVIKGNIILKQRGQEYHPKGDGIGIGKDHTLFALIDGRVKVRFPRHSRFAIEVDWSTVFSH